MAACVYCTCSSCCLLRWDKLWCRLLRCQIRSNLSEALSGSSFSVRRVLFCVGRVPELSANRVVSDSERHGFVMKLASDTRKNMRTKIVPRAVDKKENGRPQLQLHLPPPRLAPIALIVPAPTLGGLVVTSTLADSKVVNSNCDLGEKHSQALSFGSSSLKFFGP